MKWNTSLFVFQPTVGGGIEESLVSRRRCINSGSRCVDIVDLVLLLPWVSAYKRQVFSDDPSILSLSFFLCSRRVW